MPLARCARIRRIGFSHASLVDKMTVDPIRDLSFFLLPLDFFFFFFLLTFGTCCAFYASSAPIYRAVYHGT